MIVQTTHDDFEARLKKAREEGYKQAMTDLRDEFYEAHQELTKNFWSRIGKEANIEFCRRMVNMLNKRIK